jgi:MFS family permease
VSAGGLAVLCVAQFVVVLDVTIVAIALPAISRELGFQPAQLWWVITAYIVVLAGLLILGGRAADLFGAARMFRIGLVGFSVASLGCALAWSRPRSSVLEWPRGSGQPSCRRRPWPPSTN